MNLRPLGYEQYDNYLRFKTVSGVHADLGKRVVVVLVLALHLPRLGSSRRVSLANPLAEQADDQCKRTQLVSATRTPAPAGTYPSQTRASAACDRPSWNPRSPPEASIFFGS